MTIWRRFEWDMGNRLDSSVLCRAIDLFILYQLYYRFFFFFICSSAWTGYADVRR